MPLIDDLRAETPAEELDRREALGKLTGTAIGIATLGTAVTTISYLRPNVLFEPPSRFRVGRPEDYPIGSLLFLPDQKIYVAHGEAGFSAMSAVCTHLGCVTQHSESDQTITCPCHGSHFGLDGQVVVGPAPSALPKLHIALEGGQLIVDSMRIVESDFTLKV